MRLGIITFVLGFQIATGLRKPTNEVKHAKKQIDTDCKKISCPAVEDPICMKIKNKNSNKTAFVILLNKCEMRYMKCHKAMEGVTVPMKYCDHTSTHGDKHKSHTRRKRSALRGPEKILPPKRTENPLRYNSYDQDSDPSKLSYDSSGLDSRTGKSRLNKEISSENEDFMGSPEYDDVFKSDCPKECPARVRLVCGQCDHGVYKTFLSTCHLRMFNCAQHIEKMQLITRNACLSSSPLLTGEPGEDLHLEPDGRVYDRDDADPVLAFIRCRNRNSIMVDENGLEIIDAGACKDIGKKLKQDEDYDN
ncbi:uncharacterized protein LOC128682040 isoform X2 [Plodia interpunctella]|uniref:uncharacterized protein LOC128682040 isoform X2 n=1 Tax=Plodia interpunctella TaxID=58824 RepID=UPI0023679000|nr:uncharacterized protein LOC128682040 isoform X2 [Plodia interpunctella]